MRSRSMRENREAASSLKNTSNKHQSQNKTAKRPRGTTQCDIRQTVRPSVDSSTCLLNVSVQFLLRLDHQLNQAPLAVTQCQEHTIFLREGGWGEKRGKSSAQASAVIWPASPGRARPPWSIRSTQGKSASVYLRSTLSSFSGGVRS